MKILRDCVSVLGANDKWYGVGRRSHNVLSSLMDHKAKSFDTLNYLSDQSQITLSPIPGTTHATSSQNINFPPHIWFHPLSKLLTFTKCFTNNQNAPKNGLSLSFNGSFTQLRHQERVKVKPCSLRSLLEEECGEEIVRAKTTKTQHGSVFEGKSSEGSHCCCSSIVHGDSWSGSCSAVWFLSFAPKLSAKYCGWWVCARGDICCCYWSLQLWSS